MQKQTTSFRLNPRTAKNLRIMALQNDLSVGDLLAAFVRLYNSLDYFDDETKLRISAMWETAKQNARTRPAKGGWTGRPPRVDFESDDV